MYNLQSNDTERRPRLSSTGVNPLRKEDQPTLPQNFGRGDQ